MIIHLNSVVFDNDFFRLELTNGNTLIINRIDELLEDEYNTSVPIKRLNVQINTLEGESILCTDIIGLQTPYVMIQSDYPELQGNLLTEENMVLCDMECYDD